MFTLTQRTSCAGCDVTVKGAAQKKLIALLAEFEGEVGQTTDKSIDLHFHKEWQMKRFQTEAEKLSVIFD